MNPLTSKKEKRKRCRLGGKSVCAVCVRSDVVVSVPVHQALQDDLSYARDYLLELPRRIREVQQAADAVMEAGRAQ